MRPFPLPSVALASATLTLAGACGAGSDGREPVTVLAASSLTGVFEELEASFEDAHPDIDLVVSTGGSPSLAAQASEGAPSALLITADEASMGRAVDAGVVSGEPEPIATNAATIAVPSHSPGPVVDRPDDLEQGDVIVSLCAPEVPCGSAAMELLDALGVEVEADSLETSVQAVVTRLALGEADAGVVYRTDVDGSDGELRAVDAAAPSGVGTVRYLAAPLAAEPGGRQVLEHLLGPEGRRILSEHGFGPP